MSRVSMPLADPDYFPGSGNSVSFVTPGDIELVTGRLAYLEPGDRWSLFWDDGRTLELPPELEKAVCKASNPTWPHTFIQLLCGLSAQAKQCSPANHWHAVWILGQTIGRRLQYFMDLTGIHDLHASKWPAFYEGKERPVPLLKLMAGDF